MNNINKNNNTADDGYIYFTLHEMNDLPPLVVSSDNLESIDVVVIYKSTLTPFTDRGHYDYEQRRWFIKSMDDTKIPIGESYDERLEDMMWFDTNEFTTNPRYECVFL